MWPPPLRTVVFLPDPTLEFRKDPKNPPFLVSTQDVDVKPDINILQTPPEYGQIQFCIFRFVYFVCFACICEYAPHVYSVKLLAFSNVLLFDDRKNLDS